MGAHCKVNKQAGQQCRQFWACSSLHTLSTLEAWHRLTHTRGSVVLFALPNKLHKEAKHACALLGSPTCLPPACLPLMPQLPSRGTASDACSGSCSATLKQGLEVKEGQHTKTQRAARIAWPGGHGTEWSGDAGWGRAMHPALALCHAAGTIAVLGGRPCMSEGVHGHTQAPPICKLLASPAAPALPLPFYLDGLVYVSLHPALLALWQVGKPLQGLCGPDQSARPLVNTVPAQRCRM